MRRMIILLPTFLVLAALSLACRATTTLVPTPVTIPTPFAPFRASPPWGSMPSPPATAVPSPAIAPVPTVTPTPRRAQDTAPTPRLGPSPSPTAIPVPGRQTALVTRIIDGDTIEVELVLSLALSEAEGEVKGIEGRRYKLRYIGVDTPETRHPQKGLECFGREATEKNRELVEGKVVYLEKDVSETDRYGRLLRYVYLADGTFVNAELVRLGYAQVATYPPDVRYADLFLRLQREARQAGRGLWGQCQ